VVSFHLSVGLEGVSPDLSQPLEEVFSFLNNRLKITAEVDAELAPAHAKRVTACRDERQLITVTSSPARAACLRRVATRTAVPRRLLIFVARTDCARFVDLRRPIDGLVEKALNDGKPRSIAASTSRIAV